MQATIDSPTSLEHHDGIDPIEVSVVMPCLNEVRTVGICIAKAREALRRLGVASEIIIADNGSTDGSQALSIDEGARVVPVSRRGYGAALQAGIAAARGKFIIMGDSDDSYDFTGLARFHREASRRQRAGHGQSLPRRHFRAPCPGIIATSVTPF